MKKVALLLVLMVAAMGILAACGTASNTPAPAPATQAPAEDNNTPATQAPAPATQAPAPATQAPAPAAPANDFAIDVSGAQSPDFASNQGITVKYIYIWPEHADAMADTVTDIQNFFGFNIDLSVVPWDQITDTIQTSLASNSMYDDFFSWGSQIPGYIQLGAVLDLQPYFDASPDWFPEYFDNILAQEGYMGSDASLNYLTGKTGDIYGIPFRGTGEFVIYNKGLFDQNGWTLPTTQEDMVALFDKMMAAGITPITMSGTPNGGAVWEAHNFNTDYILDQAGVLQSTDNLTCTLLNYNGLLGQAAQLTKDWIAKGYYGAAPFAMQREEAQGVFFDGGAGMLFCNNNEINVLNALAGDSGITMAAFPWPKPAAAPEQLSWGGFNDGMAAWSGTQYPKQAAELLRGLTLPDVSKTWGDKGQSIVAVKGVDYSDPLMKGWADQFVNAKTYPSSATYNTGNLDELNENLFVQFCQDPNMTAQQYEDQFLANRANQIQNAASSN
jgi:raffinose/stachyose/melibiose transport system substrate-binding protein